MSLERLRNEKHQKLPSSISLFSFLSFSVKVFFWVIARELFLLLKLTCDYLFLVLWSFVRITVMAFLSLNEKSPAIACFISSLTANLIANTLHITTKMLNGVKQQRWRRIRSTTMQFQLGLTRIFKMKYWGYVIWKLMLGFGQWIPSMPPDWEMKMRNSVQVTAWSSYAPVT